MEENVYEKWFDSIYRETYPTMRRCAYAFLKLYPDLKYEVEDLIQETYIRMFNNRRELFGNDDVVKWLVVALRNMISNRLRVRKTQMKHRDWDASNRETMENIFVDPHSVVDEVFAGDDQEKLQRIEQRIGKDKLELLQEYYLDKVPLEELAKREQISPNAMKMRISRLRKKCIEIFVIILWLDALLFSGYLHIGGEGHGRQRTEEVLFRMGSSDEVDGGNGKADRSDGHGSG